MRRGKTIALAGLMLLAVASRNAGADGGAAHQVRQPRPIQLGTSGGSVEDRSSRACCSGTLGALVRQNGAFAILSNNHVLAGPVNDTRGAAINQPGNADVGCVLSADDVVADLSATVPIDFTAPNSVDAAVARVRAGQVRTDGAILDVGVPSATPLAGRFGLRVKKSGRTTGLTRGTVFGTNATVRVRYPSTCGRIAGQIATFERQLLIVGRGIVPSFSKGGDSGSLVVEDVTTCPRPVGLLFAGSVLVTFANPIADVLASLDATVVGCAAAPAPAERAAAVTPAEAAALRARDAYHERVMAIPGVVGTGLGRARGGRRPVVQVYVERVRASIRRAVPAILDGVSTVLVPVGRVVALGCGDLSPEG
jgi:hypothetical protein